MTVYRFRIADGMNPWAHAIEIEADDPGQAYRRAESFLFARINVGRHEQTVRLTEEPTNA